MDQNKKDLIYFNELYIKNSNNDKVVNNILDKLEFENIKEVISQYWKRIDQTILKRLFIKSKPKNLKEIVLKSEVNHILNNYKTNVELITNYRKLNFDELLKKIKSEKERWIDIWIKVIHWLFKKSEDVEKVKDSIDYLFDENIEIDNWIIVWLLKSKLNIKNIIDIIDYINYDIEKIILDKKLIEVFLKKINNQEEFHLISKKFKISPTSWLTQKWLLYYLIKNIELSIEDSILIVEEYWQNINIEIINFLLNKSKNRKKYIEIIWLLPLNEKLNMSSLTILLFKLNRLEELIEYFTFFDEKIFDDNYKEKFIKNYFIKIIKNKYWFNNDKDFFVAIKNLYHNTIINNSRDNLKEDIDFEEYMKSLNVTQK